MDQFFQRIVLARLTSHISMNGKLSILKELRHSIAEKEAKYTRLSELQNHIDSEVQELTEKLFQEAYRMVNDAESRRAKAEKLLLKVDYFKYMGFISSSFFKMWMGLWVCNRSINSQLTEQVLNAIKANTLELENFFESFFGILSFLFQIAVVCDFFIYIRYVNQGIVKCGVHDSYWHIITLRKKHDTGKAWSKFHSQNWRFTSRGFISMKQND
uniref:Bm4355 n=1 Tax=Brugia malayi TaxID=6279 RepID=A0A0J9XYM3_BRUMA|nr:Bm4355 [Brugia malayi]